MLTCAIDTGDIAPAHLEILDRARAIIGEIPGGFTCHQVCRIVANRLGLVHRRGWFARRGVDHSWCEIPGARVILDCYPVASAGGPLLVMTDGLLNPWRYLYVPAEVAAGFEPDSPVGPYDVAEVPEGE